MLILWFAEGEKLILFGIKCCLGSCCWLDGWWWWCWYQQTCQINYYQTHEWALMQYPVLKLNIVPAALSISLFHFLFLFRFSLSLSLSLAHTHTHTFHMDRNSLWRKIFFILFLTLFYFKLIYILCIQYYIFFTIYIKDNTLIII